MGKNLCLETDGAKVKTRLAGKGWKGGKQRARGRRAKAFKRLLETKLMGSFIPRFCCFIHTLPFTHTVASH